MDFSNLLKDIGARIRTFRKGKGLTQIALAEQAGVHSVVIGELERGYTRRGREVNPRLNTLFQIAEALEVTVGDLFPPDFRTAAYGTTHREAVADVASLLMTRDAAFVRQIYQVTRALLEEE